MDLVWTQLQKDWWQKLLERASGCLRQMRNADLGFVLAWRNHEDVKRFMYTQHEISKDEHSRWFARASVDPKRHLLIYQVADSPQGFVNLNESAPGGIAEWGFYVLDLQWVLPFCNMPLKR
jgi:RimJ/RimL family protein N-acetyltransferase